MSRPLTFGVLAGCLLAAACVPTPQQVTAQENLLLASGFNALPATTPQQVDALRDLPHDRLVKAKTGAPGRYVYADALVCGCLYVGDQTAYSRYVQTVRSRRLLLRQEATSGAAYEEGADVNAFTR